MDKTKIRVFADKVYADMAGAMTVGMAYLGVKRGLFRAMAGKGPMGAADVVQASGLHPRYVEEWLKGMTAGGYLNYDPTTETFQLPDEHAFLVASEGTDHFMGGLFLIAPALLRIAPKVAEASNGAVGSNSTRSVRTGSRRSIGSIAASMSIASSASGSICTRCRRAPQAGWSSPGCWLWRWPC